MDAHPATTVHPPAGSGGDQLHRESALVTETQFVAALMEAMPDLAMVLNEQRQIVGANRRVVEMFGLNDQAGLIGKLPGEVIGCVHNGESPGGCGSAPSCAVCGGLLAVHAAQLTGKQTTEECSITLQRSGTALDLEATATPLSIGGRDFTIFSMRDVGAQKWKQILERTFFHDIINTAGGIRGLAEVMESEVLSQEEDRKYRSWLLGLSQNLVEEIQQNQRLLAAERGEFTPDMQLTSLTTLLREVCALYENHQRAAGRHIALGEAPDCRLSTDPTVLRRILGNMLLNALEAVDAGETVVIGCRLLHGRARIEVSNQGEIPMKVQLQIFKRSFSTKGQPGRGIGTYSIKLFGERYLGGLVGFSSRAGSTTFFIELPLPAAGC